MKIDELHIDGFGIFADKKISSLSPGLNVFYGPNEAGKSTMLSFIRRVLYGYPDGRSKLNMYPPLHGGNHGGWMKIEDEDDNKFRVERYSGSAVNVIDSSGTHLGEYDLNSILGHSPEGVFRNIYAFSLSELQDFETLNSEEVRNRLYSAGAGMGNISLSDVQKEIEKQSEELFKERGSKQIITETFAECENIDKALREIQKGQGEFEKYHKELNNLSNEIIELTEEKNEFSKGLRHNTGIRDAQANWVNIIECERALKELPEIDLFPENGLVNLSKFEEKIEELQDEKSDYEAEMKKEELARDALSVDASLIELKTEIKKLQKSTDKFKSAITDYPKVLDRKETQYEELISELKEIGPNWDINKLQAFDTSISTRKTVEKYETEYKKSEMKIASLEGELANLINNYKTTHEEIEQFDKDNVNVKDTESLKSLNNKSKAIGNARISIRQIKEKEAEIRSIDERMELIQGINPIGPSSPMSMPSWPAYALLIVGAIIFIICFMYDVLLIGIINLSLLVVLALVFLGLSKAKAEEQPINTSAGRQTKKKVASSETRKAIIEEIQDLKKSLVPSLTILGLKVVPEERALEEMAFEIQTRHGTSIRLEESKKRRDEFVTKLKTIKNQKDDLKDKIKKEKQDEVTIMNKWKNWLVAKELDQDLSHDAAIEVFQIIRNCRDKLKNINEYDKRLEELGPFIKNFEKRVEAVLEASGQNTTDLDHLFEAEKISNDLESALGDEEVLKEHNLKIRNINIELEKTQEKLMKQEKKLTELLENVNVYTPDEFRSKAINWEKRKKLLETLTIEEKDIKKILGDNYQESIAELEEPDLDELERTVSEMESRLEDIEDEMDNLKENRGGILKEIENIQQEEESSSLRLEKETRLQLLKNNAEKWTVLTIAMTMMKQAIRKYEQERQPGVIKEAEKYLATMTGGKYTQIVSPMDEEKIYAIDSTGKRLDIGELSRGTAEQLYLSLRFGFIQEFNKRAVPLPIIIDDIFVNFDPERFSYAGTIISEIANSNQVLYFTCHPETAEYLTKGVGDAKLIELK